MFEWVVENQLARRERPGYYLGGRGKQVPREEVNDTFQCPNQVRLFT